MDAARARGLGKSEQPVLVEDLAHAQGDLADLGERPARTRVEVHAQLIGMVEVAATNRPRIPVDHAEVDRPHEVRGVVGHQLARMAPAGEGHGGRLDPLGCAVGDALLKEGVAVDAVDPALHHRRALFEVAHDRDLALEVVGDEVHLREAERRKEHLARVADAHLAPAGLHQRRLLLLSLGLVLLPGLALLLLLGLLPLLAPLLLGRHCWKDARSRCHAPRERQGSVIPAGACGRLSRSEPSS